MYKRENELPHLDAMPNVTPAPLLVDAALVASEAKRLRTSSPPYTNDVQCAVACITTYRKLDRSCQYCDSYYNCYNNYNNCNNKINNNRNNKINKINSRYNKVSSIYKADSISTAIAPPLRPPLPFWKWWGQCACTSLDAGAAGHRHADSPQLPGHLARCTFSNWRSGRFYGLGIAGSVQERKLRLGHNCGFRIWQTSEINRWYTYDVIITMVRRSVSLIFLFQTQLLPISYYWPSGWPDWGLGWAFTSTFSENSKIG